MKRPIVWAVTAALCLSLTLALGACASEEREEKRAADPVKSLEAAAEALSDGESEDLPILGADGDVAEGFAHSGFAAEIMDRVSVDIEETETEGESAFADAVITAPDMEQVLWDAIEGLTGEEDLSAVLAERLPELIEDAPTREFEVRLELRSVEGEWCLVPSPELTNALMGGLIEARSELIREILEDMKEGEGQ